MFKLKGAMMDTCDPLRPPPIPDWIELDESERLDLVQAYHNRQGHDLPNLDVDAVAHVIFENQAALAHETSVDAVVERLMQEDLDRHDAIHAMGCVFKRTPHEAAQDDREADLTSSYHRELAQLTAGKWLNPM